MTLRKIANDCGTSGELSEATGLWLVQVDIRQALVERHQQNYSRNRSETILLATKKTEVPDSGYAKNSGKTVMAKYIR